MKISFLNLCQYIFISLIIASCFPEQKEINNIKQDNVLKTPLYVSGYSHHNATESGAYISARIARIHHDFENASNHANRTYSLSAKDNLLIVDQSIRTALAANNLENARKITIDFLEGKPEKISDIIFITAILDNIIKNETKKAIEIFNDYKNKISNLPLKNLLGYALESEQEDPSRYLENLKGYPLFDFLNNYYSAVIEIKKGNYTLADLLLEKAAKFRDPLSVKPALIRAWLAKEAGEEGRVISIINDSLRTNPNHITEQAKLEWQNNKNILFISPIEKEDLIADILYVLGVLYSREYNYESALALLSISNNIGSKQPHGLFAMAEIYIAVKNYKKAAAIYKSLAEEYEGILKRNSILNNIFSLRAAKEYTEALTIVNNAIKHDSTFPDYYKVKGDILSKNEDYDKAIEAYNEALDRTLKEQKKNRWNVYFMRGVAYEKSGNWKKAESDLYRAMKLVPNNAEVVNYLAYSWIDRGENFEKALNLLKKAVVNEPNNGYIVDSYGWAYYKLGNYKVAEKILSKALMLVPNDPIINDHLGDVYWKVGRRREARFQWKHALEFNPKEKVIDEIKTKIEIGLDAFEERNSSLVNDESSL